MHELSIAVSIVEIAEEELARHGGERVRAIHLQVGALAGVAKEALDFSFHLACEGTPVEGSQLIIEETPGENLEIRPDGDSTRELSPRAPHRRSARTRSQAERSCLLASCARDFKKPAFASSAWFPAPARVRPMLLEKTLTALNRNCRVAALVGDLATENDALRLERSGAPVKQITTGTICHLDASMVSTPLTEWNLAELDVLFIENVGNLVCPSSYDLGEDLRVVLLSTTEGEDKPLKYPTIFNTADVAVITKIDLAEAVEFDRETAHRNIQKVRPGMRVLEVSAKTGIGMDAWLEIARHG